MASKTMSSKLTVEIRSRGETFNGEVWRAIVTTARGRCYRCDWVGRKPSEEEVIQTWRDDRRAFEPDHTGGAS